MSEKIKSFISNHKLLLIAIILYCILQYIFFYSDGKIILGGEGNYWIDFNIYLQNFGYTWLNSATGMIATSLSAIFSYPLILSFIDNIFIKSFLIAASGYLFSLLIIYLLFINLDKSNKISAIMALFFIINPFSLIFLYSLNPWGMHTLFIYPLYFLIIFRYYKSNFKLFSIFGITSLFFAYTFTNPPQAILIISSLTIFLLIIQIIKFNKILWIEWLKKSFTVYSSLLLFNIWWIAHWFLALADAKKMYTMDFAKSWLLQVSKDTILIFKDIFSLSWITSKTLGFNYFSYYYNLPYIKFFLFIPFFIVLYRLIINNGKSKDIKIVYSLSAVLIFIILFLKGANPPFKNFLLYCFDYVPFCMVFKTAPEKFGILFIFLFTLLLFFVLKNTKNKWIKYSFYFYIIICLIPFITGNFIPDYKISPEQYGSREYIDLPEFKEFRNDMKNKKLDYRLLSLPNGGIYQVMMHMYDDKYYTGMDPILSNIPQAFIADYSGDKFKDLFLSLDSNFHKKLLSIYSIKNIHLNKRLYPWFGNLVNKSTSEQERILNKNYQKKGQYGEMILYDNQFFLPHFYTPKTLIIANETTDSLVKIINQPNYQIRSAIFLKEENKDIPRKVLDKMEQSSLKKIILIETKADKVNKLNEEIKKINETITNLEAKDSKKLSKKDKLLLSKSGEEKQGLEQEKKRLLIDSAQYFAEIKDADNYDFSFRLLFCQQEKPLLLDNIPIITINGMDYDIPYEIIKAEENSEGVDPIRNSFSNGARKYKIKTDDDCFASIKNIELDKGELKMAANYILGLDNLIFSRDYPKKIDLPVLEFKKVNPTKYIVKVHQAKDSFPLVFSENFHDGWKAYINQNLKIKNQNDNLKLKIDEYKIIEGNEGDQANKEELMSYIDKGWISDLGNKGNFDFVSKNFQDTIQNDNLPGGNIWETWFKKPLPEENHLMANGYANSWWIDINQIKNYIENPDGSIDFEIVVEFWPQRLFYIGLFISGITLIGCLGYLCYERRRKKGKNDIIKTL